MNTLAVPDLLPVGLAFDAHPVAPGTVQALTADELDMVAGGFWPIVAFAVGAAIGYAVARYA